MEFINPQTLTWLLNHEEPEIRYKTRCLILEEKNNSPEIKKIQEEIRSTQRTQILSHWLMQTDLHPYKKWNGAHWVLTTLAECGYPSGDEKLIPARDRVYAWLFSERHQKSIKSIDGRVRRCASQEANAIYACIKLGLKDQTTEQLVKNLLKWQWPDGGWNCDKNPNAVNSSFWETIMPLRALITYSQFNNNINVEVVIERAAEIFLKRQLYLKQATGEVMQPEFTLLHYPTYWRYDILIGLVTLAQAGFIKDPRCQKALDLLQQKTLPGGGFPSEARFYQTTKPHTSNYSPVMWGGVSRKKPNPWVTVNALFVLKISERLKI